MVDKLLGLALGSKMAVSRVSPSLRVTGLWTLAFVVTSHPIIMVTSVRTEYQSWLPTGRNDRVSAPAPQSWYVTHGRDGHHTVSGLADKESV